MDSEKSTEVMEATSAEVLVELFELANRSSAAQSLLFDEIPVCTTATAPGFDAYSGFAPLRTQLPPGRPSV